MKDKRTQGFADDYDDPLREPIGILPAIALFVVLPIILTIAICWLFPNLP